jgi:hypothetical protein
MIASNAPVLVPGTSGLQLERVVGESATVTQGVPMWEYTRCQNFSPVHVRPCLPGSYVRSHDEKRRLNTPKSWLRMCGHLVAV